MKDEIRTEDYQGFTIRVFTDPDLENPADYDHNWKLYSFNRRHAAFSHPDNFFPSDIGLRRKLAVGTAFLLGYYEHGACQWALSGEQNYCPFDSVSAAGLLVWDYPVDYMGAKTYEERAEDARNFLRCYTDWSNGHGLGYVIEGADGEAIDSCWGFYDSDEEYMMHSAREIIDHRVASS